MMERSEMRDDVQTDDKPELQSPMVRPRFVSSALYIADLDPTVANQPGLLFDLFRQVGTVLSVRICTNPMQGSGDLPLPCHAYINFNTVAEACTAWETLNYKDLNGTPMRIMFSNLDPASRYNQNANLIIKNLEESIDSEALHHTFSALGVVLSCKVKRDARGKSLGYGFIQFQDEEDAQQAIRLVNGKLLEGKQVYLGPFIPRSAGRLEAAMNLNPVDLNPAHNSVPVQIVDFATHDIGTTIDEVVSSMSSDSSSSISSPSNSSVHSASDDDEAGTGSEVEDDGPSRLDTRRRLASIPSAKARISARAADMIKAARAAILAEKRAAAPHIDPTYVPSSEPWAPQPWSVETLMANLASAHLPEERLAMLGGTLLPLVWKCTENLASDVTNELVKMDIQDIVHLMTSVDALQAKVEETKKVVLKKILNQAPYVPKTPAPSPASPANRPTAPARDDQEPGVGIPLVTAAVLPLQRGTGFFQIGKFCKFQKGTGFFDVSRTQLVSQDAEFLCSVSSSSV